VDPQPRAKWFAYTSAASLGLEIAVAVVLCTLVGWWLENNVTHFRPWTMLGGLLVGVAAAGKAIARTIRQHEADVKAREQASGKEKERDGS
jgi:F0F1-type ATP synthase assembly protein I